MKKHIATLLLMLAGFLAIAQQQEANTLHVIGRAEIEVDPDLFDLNIGFTYTTGSMETSIEEVNKALEAMVKAITSNTKIKKDSLKTVGFNTFVNDNRYNQNKKTTYTASQSLKLTIAHEKEMIVELLNLITRIDAKINVNTRSYVSAESQAKAEETLIKIAFKHARYQGDLLSKAGNFRVGAVRSVNYTQGTAFNNPNMIQLRGRSALESDSKMSFGDFNVEKQKISKQIDVTYYIYTKQ